MRLGKKRIAIARHVAGAICPVKPPQAIARRQLTQGHRARSNKHGDKQDAEHLQRTEN
ncbi:MAG: hypothetical protein IT342_06430 [Candidatus Melainabacteria bacterium]|nr:hypothetical protein [Candidatus Melainabacteria bacterium]